MSDAHCNGASDWLAYFDDLGPQGPLYQVQSAIFVQALVAEVGVGQEHRVLDFGCGFGFVAAALAPLVAQVWMWDPAPNMRTAATRNTAGFANVRLCDLMAERPEQPTVPALDLILVNSVAQYMPPDELWAWLRSWRAMLAPGGKIVLSDLIPPDHSGWRDLVDLVRLGARYGSPLLAVRDAVGDLNRYRRTSRAAPLVRVDHDELRRRAAEAGLEVTALPGNLTHFSKRWTAVLRPRGAFREPASAQAPV